MDKSEAKDYLDCDLSIQKIVQIYRACDKAWSRPKPYPRTAEGFLYFLKGGIHYDFEGFSFDAVAGDVLRLPKDIPYCGKKIGAEDNEYIVIDFLTWQSGSFLNYPLPHAFRPADQNGTRQAFENLVHIWGQHKVGRLIEARAAFLTLVTRLTGDALHLCYGANHTRRIEMICAYLREHAHEADLHMNSVAQTFYISPTHLRRLFAAQLKISPGAYLAAVRMDKAKNLLLTRRDMSVTQISEQCGFGSVYYFSSAFKEETGMTCSQYRTVYTE